MEECNQLEWYVLVENAFFWHREYSDWVEKLSPGCFFESVEDALKSKLKLANSLNVVVVAVNFVFRLCEKQ